VAAAFVAACSPAQPTGPTHVACGAASTCPNDPPSTQSDTDECHAELDGACGAAFQAYGDCYGEKRVCAYDGTTDVLATEAACAPEARATGTCDGGTGD
jgi:hypothetical protein